MREEFDLCVEAGIKPLPVGATGFMAEMLWKEVANEFEKHFPSASAEFKTQFQKLGDTSKAPAELLETLQTLIEYLQNAENF